MNPLIDVQLKRMIENNPVALATIMPDGRPNVISVAYVKVIDKKQLLITDNYMNQTLKDLQKDPHIVALVWSRDLKGAKMIGTAKYFDRGIWWEQVKRIPANKGFPVKGAVLITIDKIVISA
jgi:predicted pyridoxine 5'-phosphate oxidase superfamily flavin-nucleotide-binding protein